MQVYTTVLSNMHIQQYISTKVKQAGYNSLQCNDMCLSIGTGEEPT